MAKKLINAATVTINPAQNKEESIMGTVNSSMIDVPKTGIFVTIASRQMYTDNIEEVDAGPFSSFEEAQKAALRAAKFASTVSVVITIGDQKIIIKEDSTMATTATPTINPNAKEAKTMTEQELINKAQSYGIPTENASIEDIAEVVITHLMFCSQLSLPHCNGHKDDIMKEIQSVKAFLATKKETTINPNKKEVKTMTKKERILDTWRRVNECPKTSDAGYVDRKELVQLFDDCMGNRPNSKVTRTQLVESLESIAKSFDKPQVKEEPLTVPAGDLEITKDTAPQENIWTPTVYDKDLAIYLIEKVVRHMDKSINQTFITEHMLTSIIAEKVVGKPLQGYENNVLVKYHETFTEEQVKNIQDIRATFIKNNNMKAHFNKDIGKITGYFMPINILVCARAKFLNKKSVLCSKQNTNDKILVSIYGVQNPGTNEVIKQFATAKERDEVLAGYNQTHYFVSDAANK
jgi:hypothetical protein